MMTSDSLDAARYIAVGEVNLLDNAYEIGDIKYKIRQRSQEQKITGLAVNTGKLFLLVAECSISRFDEMHQQVVNAPCFQKWHEIVSEQSVERQFSEFFIDFETHLDDEEAADLYSLISLINGASTCSKRQAECLTNLLCQLTRATSD